MKRAKKTAAKTTTPAPEEKWVQISWAFGVRGGKPDDPAGEQALCFEAAAQVAHALGHEVRCRFDPADAVPIMILLEAKL